MWKVVNERMSFKNNGFSLFLGQRRHKIFCIFHIKGNDRKFDGSGGGNSSFSYYYHVIIHFCPIHVDANIYKKKFMLHYKSITNVKSRSHLCLNTWKRYINSIMNFLCGTQRKTCHFMCVIEPGNNLHQWYIFYTTHNSSCNM